jgi:hypothetical protein
MKSPKKFMRTCLLSLTDRNFFAKKHRTFEDLATDYCSELTSCFAKAHTVADVFDRYDVKKTPSISGFPNEPAM